MLINFDHVSGQKHLRYFLDNAFQSNRLGHSFLLHGPDGVGKLAVALAFSKALLCEADAERACNSCKHCKQVAALAHPGITLIFPHPKAAKVEELVRVNESVASNPYCMERAWPGSLISIDRIRKLKKDLGFRSFEGRSRLIIINDMHMMTAEATNSLLKILEEPPEKTCFLLITTKLSGLLPTIISRCQQLRFDPLQPDEIETGLREKETGSKTHDYELISRLAGGSMRRAFRLMEDGFSEKKSLATDILRTAFKKPSNRAAFATELANSNDKFVIREMLGFILLWLRDAMYISCLGDASDSSQLVNLDQRESLFKFVKSLPDFDYEHAMTEVDRSMLMLDRHVQPALVLTVMMRNLASPAVAAGVDAS